MTPLENKIWDMVSKWAEKQYYPINDFALRSLMDEILMLVNEESKEAEIKKLVEELKESKKSDVVNGTQWTGDTNKRQLQITFIDRNILINKLENILNGMDKRKG